MSEKLIQKSIDEVNTNPCIKWNDLSLIETIQHHATTKPEESEYLTYILNRPINNRLQCGYYTLIHNIIATLPERSNILEVGNREGLSTLAIYDALNESSKFVSIDIVKDLRFVPPEVFEDPRFIFGVADCLDPISVLSTQRYFFPNKIDFVFFDTIHTYKQISSEYQNFKNILSDDCIILVDDINLADKGKFYDEWEGPKWKLGYNFHGPAGFAVFRKKNNDQI